MRFRAFGGKEKGPNETGKDVVKGSDRCDTASVIFWCVLLHADLDDAGMDLDG